jgi:hypothetical protein
MFLSTGAFWILGLFSRENIHRGHASSLRNIQDVAGGSLDFNLYPAWYALLGLISFSLFSAAQYVPCGNLYLMQFAGRPESRKVMAIYIQVGFRIVILTSWY